MTTILTIVTTAIVAPNVVFAVWVGRNEWRRGRARRAAVVAMRARVESWRPLHSDPVSFDRHAEDAIRLVREWKR